MFSVRFLESPGGTGGGSSERFAQAAKIFGYNPAEEEEEKAREARRQNIIAAISEQVIQRMDRRIRGRFNFQNGLTEVFKVFDTPGQDQSLYEYLLDLSAVPVELVSIVELYIVQVRNTIHGPAVENLKADLANASTEQLQEVTINEIGLVALEIVLEMIKKAKAEKPAQLEAPKTLETDTDSRQEAEQALIEEQALNAVRDYLINNGVEFVARDLEAYVKKFLREKGLSGFLNTRVEDRKKWARDNSVLINQWGKALRQESKQSQGHALKRARLGLGILLYFGGFLS